MEKRVDPADGVAYTFKDISAFYARQYSQQEIQQYWNQRCKPVFKREAVEDPPWQHLEKAKVSFCPDPKTLGVKFTAIYEKTPEDSKAFASVNAGNGKKLKVGGGTINLQFAQELQAAAGHDPYAYSPAHEGLLRAATKSGLRAGLIPAGPGVELPAWLEGAFLYLGPTNTEAEEVAADPGRAGLVILDMFEKNSRPYHAQNVAMVYTVGPSRSDEADDDTFLSKVRQVGRNVVMACHDYNAQLPPGASSIDKMRLCLVSGGKFAGRVPKEEVARQLVLGVLDAQLADSSSPEALPEVQFAYDTDVFRQVWEALVAKK
ncbi:unnamed protein product [Durusdinium trenchii]|uniref:Uncharacterized protein n=1 Tax=Durusdinium trenchii TaxID=1381693 RepID=A0ABP0LEV2_9DINO